MHPIAASASYRSVPCFQGISGRARVFVCIAVLCSAAHGAQAADWLDSLFGKTGAPSAVGKPGAGQRVWKLHEFTTMALVPAEPAAAPNAQATLLSVDALRQVLASARVASTAGAAVQPLFGADELAELVGPLAEAFARAGPGDDVLLLSASRRERGLVAAPTAITARLFVQGDALQVIVHDARLDFYDAYRATSAAPRFVFGSRSRPAAVELQMADATQVRSDWLSIPLTNLASGVPTSGPGAAKAAPPASPRAPDAAGAEDAERRLKNLKRLRELNLITEEEHQKKRLEILQLL